MDFFYFIPRNFALLKHVNTFFLKKSRQRQSQHNMTGFILVQHVQTIVEVTYYHYL